MACNDKWDGERDLYGNGQVWSGVRHETRNRNEPWKQEQVCLDPVGWIKIGACPCLYLGGNLARVYTQVDGGPLTYGLPFGICPPPLMSGMAAFHSLIFTLGGCCNCCCPTDTLSWACLLAIDPCSIPYWKYAIRRDMYFKYGIQGLREGGYSSAYAGGCASCWPVCWPIACMQCRQESAELDFHEGEASKTAVAPS